MKVGIYKDGVMDIYNSNDSIIMIQLDDYDKQNIANMHDKDNNYLRVDQQMSSETLSKILKEFISKINNQE